MKLIFWSRETKEIIYVYGQIPLLNTWILLSSFKECLWISFIFPSLVLSFVREDIEQPLFQSQLNPTTKMWPLLGFLLNALCVHGDLPTLIGQNWNVSYPYPYASYGKCSPLTPRSLLPALVEIHPVPAQLSNQTKIQDSHADFYCSLSAYLPLCRDLTS